MEGALHQRHIVHLQRRQRRAGTHALRQRAQHAVGGADDLRLQHRAVQQLAAQVGQRTAAAAHLGGVHGRRHRLRSQGGIDQGQPLTAHAAIGLQHPHARVRVARAAGTAAVEDVAGTAIPQQAVVEHRVDDRGRIARRHAARTDAADLVHRIGRPHAAVGAGHGVADRLELAAEGAARAGHVVGDAGQAGDVGFGQRIGRLRERKVRHPQHLVRATAQPVQALVEARRHLVLAAGHQLVAHPAVGPRLEVAGGTGHAVAAHVAVPEQGLAKLDGRLAVDDDGLGPVIQTRHRWHRHALERHRHRTELGPGHGHAGPAAGQRQQECGQRPRCHQLHHDKLYRQVDRGRRGPISAPGDGGAAGRPPRPGHRTSAPRCPAPARPRPR